MNSSRASAFRAGGALGALVFMFTALTAHAQPAKPHESPVVESPPGDTLFQKALGQLAQKEVARDTADILLRAIRDAGQEIVFGPPEIQASMQHPERVDIIVPVSLKASDAVKAQLEEAARSLDGLIKPANYERRPGVVLQIAQDPEILEYFHRRVAGLVFMAQLVLNDGSVYRCYDEDESRNVQRNPIAPVRLMWTSPKENRIVGLGINPSLSKTQDVGMMRTAGRDRGSIVIFEESITFHVTFTIPLDQAKNIKDIEGKFMQWKLTDLDAYSSDRSNIPMRGACRVSQPER